MDIKYVVLGLVIGTLLGSSGGILYTQFERTNLQIEVKNLQDNLSELSEKFEVLNATLESKEEEFSQLNDAYQSLKEAYEELNYSYTEYQELKEAYQKLNYSYVELLRTLELFDAKNFSRQVPFNITCEMNGEVTKTWTFDIGYGILMRTSITFSRSTYGCYISIGTSWMRGDQRGLLGGSGIAYTQLPEYLTGVAYCEIYDEGGNFIQATCGVKPTQPSWQGSARTGRFSKTL